MWLGLLQALLLTFFFYICPIRIIPKIITSVAIYFLLLLATLLTVPVSAKVTK